MSHLTSPPDALAHLKPEYRSGVDNLDTDFFRPCLMRCTTYDRAVGYFTSSALASWADAIPNLLSSTNVRVRLVIGPTMLSEDKRVLAELADDHTRMQYTQHKADALLSEVIDILSVSSAARLSLFAWLVANERLEIRFAFPAHVQDADSYHEKFGVFSFATGHKVAFTGSANETAGGYRRNYENIDVYRSWIAGDLHRVDAKIRSFEDTWSGNSPGLTIYAPSPSILQRVRDLAHPTKPKSPSAGSLWKHQEEAVNVFLAKRRGILEMATGTGKTRTALRVAAQLLQDGAIRGMVVTAKGNDLLDQWAEDIRQDSVLRDFVLYKHYGKYHDTGLFTLHPEGSILLSSRLALPELRSALDAKSKTILLAVHDEVHGFGSPLLQRQLYGFHEEFASVMGLSATPEREYDDEGNAFIYHEIGPVIYQYGLAEALRDGVLCPFNYKSIDYELTENDRTRLHQIVAAYEAARAAGRPWPDDQLYRELARVYKTAEDKPRLFDRLVRDDPSLLRHCIIFADTQEFAERLLGSIGRVTTSYSTYFEDDPPARLDELSSGQLDCLLCCKRLAEGIDIRHLKNIILVSSDRARLNTIQRIGRTLRKDPEDPLKVATVVDFVLRDGSDDHPDHMRKAWLQALSSIRSIRPLDHT